MNFLAPLGFLGLLGIAALIIIYLFKPKYRDRPVSSTYIWKRSLKYMKKRPPIDWRNSLLFFLQVLIIAIIAAMLARPHVEAPVEAGEKIIVLDASASMLAGKNGETRFDRAVADIMRLTGVVTPEDKVTVILAAEEAFLVARRTDSAAYVKQALSDIACGYSSGDVAGAMALAAEVVEENPGAEVILYTDIDYPEPGSVTVKNMSDGEWNAAILDFSVRLEGGYNVFSATVASYGKDAELSVALNADGRARSVKTAQLSDGKPLTLVWSEEKIIRYGSADVSIDADDSFPYDNSFHLFGGDEDPFRVQLVSGTPDFYRAALNAVSYSRIDTPARLRGYKTSGYDLYIFDGFMPAALPEDGAVWLFNPTGAPDGAGFVIDGEIQGFKTLSASNTLSEAEKIIMDSIIPQNIEITRHARLSEYDGYETLMLGGGEPILLTKNKNGVKTTILALDIHNTNLPLLIEFPVLLHNLGVYSMPPTVERTVFNVGEDIVVNVKPSMRTMVINDTKKSARYDIFPVIISARYPGVYTAMQFPELNDAAGVPAKPAVLQGARASTSFAGTAIIDRFFVRIPERESIFYLDGEKLPYMAAEAGSVLHIAGHDEKKTDNLRDIFFYFAAVLSVFILLEWWLQYREHY